MTPAPNPMLPAARIDRDDGSADATAGSTYKTTATAPSTIEIDIDGAIIRVRLGVDQAWLLAC
jgi:hypothetical protein